MKTSHARKLVPVELEPFLASIPTDVAALLADARLQIDALEDRSRAAMPAFVPSDFKQVYESLSAIQESHLATGRRFLEWGSGIGVVSCLATQLGFDAVGIEIEQSLVDIAERVARTHSLDTQFVCGSFLPDGTDVSIESPDDVAWLTTHGSPAYEELDLAPDDFDLIYAYPWPGEEQVIFDLFASCASTGALLLTYHGIEGMRLHRKVRS